MNFYENYILPHLIHWACSIKPIMYQRKKVIPMAKGTVLEVGIGTGLNLPFYDLNKINKVIGLEPSKKMHTKANETARRSNVSLELIDRYAEDIPLDDDSVDTIVVTYTLCSINETDNALKELHRVLKNDGFLIFCETFPPPLVLLLFETRGEEGKVARNSTDVFTTANFIA